MKNRRLILKDVENFSLEEGGIPEDNIKMLASGICGTDKHAIKGRLDLDFPMLLGHENVGRVDGKRVVWPPILPCGKCKYCSKGMENLVLVEQYTLTVGILDELFQIAPDLCWKEDGIGCCSIKTEEIEKDIVGPAKGKILNLREEKLKEVEIQDHNACKYHKMDSGCILDGLKSPICIAHYCKGDLDKTNYDQDYVYDSLRYLLDTETETGSLKGKIESGWDIVAEIEGYVKDIKEELILSNPGKFNNKILETHP